MLSINNAELRKLKSRAQLLKATIKLGRAGVTPQFLQALDLELQRLELVKVKFDEFKEQKKELAPLLAEKTNSCLVIRVGHVAVLYRPKPPAPKPPAESPGA